jgi:hypothetical protein
LKGSSMTSQLTENKESSAIEKRSGNTFFICLEACG